MTGETVKWFLGLLLTSAIFEKILDRIFARFDKKKDKSDKILEQISTVEKQIDAVEKKLDGHIAEEDRYKADLCRTRILRFSDEIRRDIKHSEESFNNVLEDIDYYVAYCEQHEDVYINSKADAAIKNVKDVYNLCITGVLDFL